MAKATQDNFTITEILKAANRYYAQGYLSMYFDEDTGAPKVGGGDTLARFVVRELSETYDQGSSRAAQLGGAVRALEGAKSDIQKAIDGLNELKLRENE